VIYAQNWKQLLGNAAKTMFLVVLGSAAIILGVFVVLMLLFRVIGWPAWVAFFISVFMAFTLKSAFIDSFILARTMVAYMNVAPTTVITFDLYGKLSKVSAKFKQLWSKGQEEDPSPQPGAPAYAGAGYGAQPGAPAYAGAGYGAQPGAPAYAGAGYGAQPGAPAYAGAGYGAQPGAPAYAGAGYGAQPGAPAYAGAGYGVQPGAPAYAGAGYGVQPAGPAYAGAGYGAQPAGPAYAGMGYGAQPAGPAYAGTGYGAQPATQHVPYGSPSINAVYCRQCNALNAQGGKHCSSCGAPL
ncbi:MAG: hypothetical protein FWH33_07380, partial [Oscillospiraceae bacterium]|nr:hypothetical protein [Oscillospiraceae bacterium]